MIDRIRTKLIELARQRTTWSYTQLNDQLELGLNFSNPADREYIGELLGEITTHEFKRERPLLSCLITHQNGLREQGDGFYKLCEQLFKQDWLTLKCDKEWENGLIADCYTFWLNTENYIKHKNDF
jgi:hypothetical protein